MKAELVLVQALALVITMTETITWARMVAILLMKALLEVNHCVAVFAVYSLHPEKNR
jgi:hypothetical protein